MVFSALAGMAAKAIGSKLAGNVVGGLMKTRVANRGIGMAGAKLDPTAIDKMKNIGVNINNIKNLYAKQLGVDGTGKGLEHIQNAFGNTRQGLMGLMGDYRNEQELFNQSSSGYADLERMGMADMLGGGSPEAIANARAQAEASVLSGMRNQANTAALQRKAGGLGVSSGSVGDVSRMGHIAGLAGYNAGIQERNYGHGLRSNALAQAASARQQRLHLARLPVAAMQDYGNSYAQEAGVMGQRAAPVMGMYAQNANIYQSLGGLLQNQQLGSQRGAQTVANLYNQKGEGLSNIVGGLKGIFSNGKARNNNLISSTGTSYGPAGMTLS